MKANTIIVRSIIRNPFTGKFERAEWTETVHSWKAAWRVVDDCCADRSECRKVDLGDGLWALEIG